MWLFRVVTKETNGKKVKGGRGGGWDRGMMVVPYVQGPTEKVSRVFKKRRMSIDPI